MISLLLASVTLTAVGQFLFIFVILRYRWYGRITRALVCLGALTSCMGAAWFVGGTLIGMENGLTAAIIYSVPQGIALWLILASRMYDIFSNAPDRRQWAAVDKRLEHMEESDEDRFSEGELEKHEVRGRLVEATKEQNAKLDEILRLLRRGR